MRDLQTVRITKRRTLTRCRVVDISDMSRRCLMLFRLEARAAGWQILVWDADFKSDTLYVEMEMDIPCR